MGTEVTQVKQYCLYWHVA